MVAEQDSVRAAFTRARQRVALVHRIWPEARGLELYAVGSSRDPEVAYVVRVLSERVYRCTCAAAEAGRTCCVHRAAVHLVRWRDRAHREQAGRAAGLIGAAKRLPPSAANAWLDAQDRRAEASRRSQAAARRMAEIALEQGS